MTKKLISERTLAVPFAQSKSDLVKQSPEIMGGQDASGAMQESPPEKTAVTTNKEAEITADKEIGGRDGPDPTRYGDWELNGRCIDF